MTTTTQATLEPVVCPQWCDGNHDESWVEPLGGLMHAARQATSNGISVEVVQMQFVAGEGGMCAPDDGLTLIHDHRAIDVTIEQAEELREALRLSIALPRSLPGS